MTSNKKLNSPQPSLEPQALRRAPTGKPGDRQREILKAAVKLFSVNGFFQTKIDDIANEAKVSKGLIYLHFKDKHDVLFCSLRFVLETYQFETSRQLDPNKSPLQMLRKALRTYCRLIAGHKDETLLAYRSTKDLRPADRLHIKLLESKSGRIFRNSLEACIHQGLYKPVNVDIMTYQFILFCHAWALKHWAFKERCDLEEYLDDGEKILIDSFLTEAGRAENPKLDPFDAWEEQ